MKLIRSAAALLALGAAFTAPALAEGDAVAGEKVFKKCMTCHSLEEGKNKVGPSLHNIMGRAAGTVEGYKYSKANAKAAEDGLVWTEEVMSEYLVNPRKYMPGTKMAFAGLKKEADIANLIAYLKNN